MSKSPSTSALGDALRLIPTFFQESEDFVRFENAIGLLGVEASDISALFNIKVEESQAKQEDEQQKTANILPQYKMPESDDAGAGRGAVLAEPQTVEQILDNSFYYQEDGWSFPVPYLQSQIEVKSKGSGSIYDNPKQLEPLTLKKTAANWVAKPSEPMFDARAVIRGLNLLSDAVTKSRTIDAERLTNRVARLDYRQPFPTREQLGRHSVVWLVIDFSWHWLPLHQDIRTLQQIIKRFYGTAVTQEWLYYDTPVRAFWRQSSYGQVKETNTQPEIIVDTHQQPLVIVIGSEHSTASGESQQPYSTPITKGWLDTLEQAAAGMIKIDIAAKDRLQYKQIQQDTLEWKKQVPGRRCMPWRSWFSHKPTTSTDSDDKAYKLLLSLLQTTPARFTAAMIRELRLEVTGGSADVERRIFAHSDFRWSYGSLYGDWPEPDTVDLSELTFSEKSDWLKGHDIIDQHLTGLDSFQHEHWLHAVLMAPELLFNKNFKGRAKVSAAIDWYERLNVTLTENPELSDNEAAWTDYGLFLSRRINARNGDLENLQSKNVFELQALYDDTLLPIITKSHRRVKTLYPDRNITPYSRLAPKLLQAFEVDTTQPIPGEIRLHSDKGQLYVSLVADDENVDGEFIDGLKLGRVKSVKIVAVESDKGKTQTLYSRSQIPLSGDITLRTSHDTLSITLSDSKKLYWADDISVGHEFHLKTGELRWHWKDEKFSPRERWYSSGLGRGGKIHYDDQGPYFELQTGVTSLKFRYIPRGNGFVGSPQSEADRLHDEPLALTETLNGFWMAETPISEAQFHNVIKLGRSLLSPQIIGKHERKNYPQVNVTWEEAVNFCSILKEMLGVNVKLPTEVQWEYACRAGQRGAFSNEQQAVNNNDATRQLVEQTVPAFDDAQQNEWGLKGLHGLCQEWCADDYLDNRDVDMQVERRPPERVPLKVLKGGSFLSDQSFTRSASRQAAEPSSRLRDVGFRPIIMMSDSVFNLPNNGSGNAAKHQFAYRPSELPSDIKQVNRLQRLSDPALLWQFARPSVFPCSWASGWGCDQFSLWQTLRVGGQYLKLRYVPPGEFIMGKDSEEGEESNSLAAPAHKVRITRGFWLSEKAVGGESGLNCPWFPGQTPSSVLDMLKLWNKPGFSLPTEAQWEYAMQAGQTVLEQFKRDGKTMADEDVIFSDAEDLYTYLWGFVASTVGPEQVADDLRHYSPYEIDDPQGRESNQFLVLKGGLDKNNLPNHYSERQRVEADDYINIAPFRLCFEGGR